MTSGNQPNNLDATVFVYRNEAGVIRCECIDRARSLEKNLAWKHPAALEPRRWIESHWFDVQITGGAK